jgi:Tfp pilus assembly PilM family ATPase
VEPVFRIGDEEDEPKPGQVFDLGAEAAPSTPPAQPPPRPAGLPVLHTPGSGTPGRQVYESMLPTLVELVTEIRRSIEYYSNRFPDSRVDKILLYGGTACLPNFAEFLAGEVGTAVEVGNPFLRVEVDQGVPHEFIEQNAPYMPIVVGLAIRDMLD